MKQTALAAVLDRAAPKTQCTQLRVPDHRVVLDSDRRDQTIDMFERYLVTLVRARDGSSITQVIER